VVANCLGAQRTTVLPQRVTAVAALSTGVKGSTVVVSLVLGGVSEPSQSSSFPGAEVFRGTGTVGLLEDWQGDRPANLLIEKLRSTRNTSHHSEFTVALKVQ
jgi:hypothetical protein